MHAFSYDERSKLLEVFRSFCKGDMGPYPSRESVEKKLMNGEGDFNDIERYLLENALAYEIETLLMLQAKLATF